MKLNKKIALIAAGSLLSAGGLYAVTTSASAASPTAPALTAPAVGLETPIAGDSSDSDNIQVGNQNDAESSTEGAIDSADIGPDMNASEPGHQDGAGADDASEAADGTESASK